MLSVKSPQFSNCPYAKCHFIDPSLTGLALPSQPSLPLSTTTNPILDCRGKGTKRTFHRPFYSRLLKSALTTVRIQGPTFSSRMPAGELKSSQKLLNELELQSPIKLACLSKSCTVALTKSKVPDAINSPSSK